MPGAISDIVGGRRNELCKMPWPEYKAFPALNASVLVHGRKSLKHLKHAWDQGFPDTDAMAWGRMVHCLLFEPSEFESRYWPWHDRRAGKAYWEYCAQAEAAEAEVVRGHGQYSLASAIEAAQSFLQDDRAQALISAGAAEQTVLTVEGGLQCKGRLDWVSTSEHVLVDLKTPAQIEPELFGKTFFNFDYDIKLGVYRRWLNRLTNDHWPVEVIVLESKPPYDIGVIPIPDAVLDAGIDDALALIRQVAEAIETDQWPGIAGGKPLSLVVPYWAMEEETTEFEG